MPARPSLAVTRREFMAQTARLRALCRHIPAFNADYRMLLSEMIALQAFYCFETAIEGVAAKLVCGSRYGDGTAPTVRHAARSIDDALHNMRTVGRTRPKGILKWNQAREITANVQHVMATTEAFCTACRNHASRLNEIRVVRNHIAHNNQQTKREFAGVVRRRLGALPQRLPRAGAFVLREFTPGVPLLVEFVVSLEVIVTDAMKL
jgi:hypothetical protein